MKNDFVGIPAFHCKYMTSMSFITVTILEQSGWRIASSCQLRLKGQGTVVTNPFSKENVWALCKRVILQLSETVFLSP